MIRAYNHDRDDTGQLQMEHPTPKAQPDAKVIHENVRAALAEDVGKGDVTATLIEPEAQALACVFSRDRGIFCGIPWAAEVCTQVDADIQLNWLVADGDNIEVDSTIVELVGRARSLLTVERTMLNFLQLLSGTATQAHACVAVIKHTKTRVLDTRKTLPGLRIAQKYAVSVGGANNHRTGLYDAFLIKENHIVALGGIATVVEQARALHPDLPVEVEVENLEQLDEALGASPDIIMLDNFSTDEMTKAVRRNNSLAKIEASGGLTLSDLSTVAHTGVDYISIGAITKNVNPLDLSMRFK